MLRLTCSLAANEEGGDPDGAGNVMVVMCNDVCDNFLWMGHSPLLSLALIV